MSAITAHFLQPIAKFLGKPMKPGYAEQLEAEFSHLSPEALSEAARKLLPNLTGVPALKVLQKALRSIDAAIHAPVRTGVDPWDFEGQMRAHYMRRREAACRCKCNLGRRADKEGWLPAMIDFTYDHGRIPEGMEIERCIAKARRSEQALDEARGSPFYRSLVTMRLNMLERASLDVFGDEAIKRTPDQVLMAGSMGTRAGSDAVEREKALRRLEELKAAPHPTLSDAARDFLRKR